MEHESIRASRYLALACQIEELSEVVLLEPLGVAPLWAVVKVGNSCISMINWLCGWFRQSIL